MSCPPTGRRDPRHYLEKIDRRTGHVLGGPIRPEDLLVEQHRDGHPVDVWMRWLLGTVVNITGNEEFGGRAGREIRRLGHGISGSLERVVPAANAAGLSRRLFGLRDEVGYRFRPPACPAGELSKKVDALRQEGARRLKAALQGEGLRILLTGGSGFIGKEIIWQLRDHPQVREVVVLLRPERIRSDGRIRRLAAAERGERLLDHLGIHDAGQRDRFRFVDGDIDKKGLGLDPALTPEAGLTHVVHGAASVAFDDSYESSWRSNVAGARHVLEYALDLQRRPGSAFVAYLSIETSYSHGRKFCATATEDELSFPDNYYNNYYELTKAMAGIETEKFMLERGLRVVRLCPSIVIGAGRTGNNRGDTKVINAPVNVFGRIHEELQKARGLRQRLLVKWIMERLCYVFPGSINAVINLIPVDYVAAGIVAALDKPEAIGERIHLASDQGIAARDLIRACFEELGVRVHLSEPTAYRNVVQPFISGALKGVRQGALAGGLSRLGTIFGNYSEWGQPVYEVGKDHHVLGLEGERPRSLAAFRMLCRHNRYVQEFGRLRDPLLLARREALWEEFVEDLARQEDSEPGLIPAAAFRAAMERSGTAAALAGIPTESGEKVGDGGRPR